MVIEWKRLAQWLAALGREVTEEKVGVLLEVME